MAENLIQILADTSAGMSRALPSGGQQDLSLYSYEEAQSFAIVTDISSGYERYNGSLYVRVQCLQSITIEAGKTYYLNIDNLKGLDLNYIAFTTTDGTKKLTFSLLGKQRVKNVAVVATEDITVDSVEVEVPYSPADTRVEFYAYLTEEAIVKDDSFVVELNIGGRLLTYDKNNGLLSCIIPRQMQENPTQLSFGIISQQAVIELEDYNLKLRKLVAANKIINNTTVNVFFNGNVIYYGFVNETVYDDDNSTIELKVADPLILLNDSITTTSIVANQSTTGQHLLRLWFNKLVEFTNELLLNAKVPMNIYCDEKILALIDSIENTGSGIPIFITGHLYDDWNRFLNTVGATLSCTSDTIYVRSAV